MESAEKPVLDSTLVFAEPVEIGVEIIFVEALQTEDVAGGMGACEAHRAQARALVDDTRDHLPERELSLP